MRARAGYILGLAGLLAAGLAAGCSTTRRLAPDDKLYTGVKKIEIVESESHSVPSGVLSAAKEPLTVKPNNPLFPPYVRTGLPIGLWIWNWFYTESGKGFKGWVYRRLAKEPVTVRNLSIPYRTQMVVEELENNGYFGARCDYTEIPSKHNTQKVKFKYEIRIPPAYHYTEVGAMQGRDTLSLLIDSLWKGSKVRQGARFSVDTMVYERDRIGRELRNRGYYYFRPEYIEFQADSSAGNRSVALRLALRKDMPHEAGKSYVIGDVTMVVAAAVAGEWDTVTTPKCVLAYQKPLRVKKSLLINTLELEKGKPYSLKDQNATLDNLNRLGAFKLTDIVAVPRDSTPQNRILDFLVNTAVDTPLESSLEVDGTSKSNSYVGPGAEVGFTNKNFLKGGELLSVKLSGEYEWQMGTKTQVDQSTPTNSYDFGLNASLTVPRPWLPRFLTKSLAYPATTSLNTGINVTNRPGLFQMASFDMSIRYNFQSSKSSFHSFTPAKVEYNNLLRSSASFDQTMAENPSLALSFEDQLIPSMEYAYTFRKEVGYKGMNRIWLQTIATSAGNIISPLMGAMGDDVPRKILGIGFSQFAKGQAEFRFTQHVGAKNSLVLRFFGGIGYAYGNSQVMPYNEQFYSGGSSSVRGFSSRSIGPGSYVPDPSNSDGYLDQTGDIRLEWNAEFRFPIISRLSGAVFLDAGNVWLIKPDGRRTGGAIGWDTMWKQIALGTGTGIRVDITYLVLRFDVGMPLHYPYAVEGKSGYFNDVKPWKNMSFYLAIGYPF